MFKGEGGFLNDVTSILWLDDSLYIPCAEMLMQRMAHVLFVSGEKAAPTRPRVPGPVLARFSLCLSVGTGLFLWCWLHGAVSSEGIV